MPAIIRFSNREFYDGALKIMTRQPQWANQTALVVIEVAGSRGHDGRNTAEADAIVEELRRWVEREVNITHEHHSLGILSPFRDQVELLSKRIADEFTVAQIEKHSILIGTAYAFQGEERDVMFLSWTVDAQSKSATFRYLNRADVFNVSITRARIRQILFTSVRPTDVPANGYFRRYLEEASHTGEAQGHASSESSDPFLAAVKAAVEEHGFKAYVAWAMAGMTIDLLVEREGRSLGIDLIGSPGRFEAIFELDRYRMLERAGLAVLPLTWWAWQRDPSASIDLVLKRWQTLE